jgi:hypothetical protein
LRKPLKNTKGEKIPDCFPQPNVPIETIQDKKQPNGNGYRIYNNLEQELMVDFKITGCIVGKVT